MISGLEKAMMTAGKTSHQEFPALFSFVLTDENMPIKHQ
jgi:hypothetical protein